MDPKKLSEYTEKNRKSWNQTMPFHKKARGTELLKNFKNPTYLCLDNLEIKKLKELNLNNKVICQLCCNNARELISLIRLGAKEGYGFDISEEAIKNAEEINEIAKTNCKFIQTDVYNIDKKYYNKFDIIYISAGSINWLPDISKFFEVISKLLKSKGFLFMYDIHPISEIFASDDNPKFDSKNPYKIINSYFDNLPKIGIGGIDYLGKEKYKSEPNYWFTHTLSDIINSCIKNKLKLTEFNEYPEDISAVLEQLQKEKLIPLSFTLICEKE